MLAKIIPLVRWPSLETSALASKVCERARIARTSLAPSLAGGVGQRARAESSARPVHLLRICRRELAASSHTWQAVWLFRVQKTVVPDDLKVFSFKPRFPRLAPGGGWSFDTSPVASWVTGSSNNRCVTYTTVRHCAAALSALIGSLCLLRRALLCLCLADA